MTTKQVNAYLHFELLSDAGERGFGTKPYTIVLTKDYKTNGTEKTIIDNLKHSKDVALGLAEEDIKNFPYVRYLTGNKDDRLNTFVYLSRRNILTLPLQEIKDWMLELANSLNWRDINSIENTQAALLKIAWSSNS